jgi:hypothetical protein
MSTPGPSAPLGDDAILAAPRPAIPAPLPAAPRPSRRWPWVLLGLTTLGPVLALLAAALLWHEVQGPHGLAGAADWRFGWHEDGWHGEIGPGGVLGVLLAVLATLLVVAVVVPLVLLGSTLAVGLALALAALAVAVTVALGLGALALALLLVSSPLWLAGLLLWWALKPSAPAVASASSV